MSKKTAVALLLFSVSIMPISSLLNEFIPFKATYAFLLFFSSFLISCAILINDFKFESTYFKYVFYLFILYEFVIILRGGTSFTDNLKENIRTSHLFWPFIIPLFVFFDKNLTTLSYVIKNCYHLCLIFLLVSICFPWYLTEPEGRAESLIRTLAIGSGFLMMNGVYISNRKVNIAFVVSIISLLSMTFLARRNMMVTFIGFIISAYFLNILNGSKRILFKIFPVIIIGCIILLLSINSFTDSLTNTLSGRLLSDTRSAVIQRYIYDMSDYFFFGKGLGGTYFSPTGVNVEGNVAFNQIVYYRNVIENGYLQLILSGGFVHLFLFLLVVLPAGLLGVLKSRNQFCKASGALILLWLTDMFIYGLPAIKLHYLLVWICVGVCYKASLRKKTDDEIRSEFHLI